MFTWPFSKNTVTAIAFMFSTASVAAGWVNGNNIISPGVTIHAIASGTDSKGNKNSYTGDPSLNSNASGVKAKDSWLSFLVTSPTNVVITLTSAKTNAPGFTVYRTDGEFVGKGTGTTSGTDGSINSFNQIAQAGTPGIIWATDDSVNPTYYSGNLTANGIVETLGYVNGSNVDYINSYKKIVSSGAHDLSIDNRFENGVYGSISEAGGLNYANLNLLNVSPGYYTIFLGGTNSGGLDTPIDVKVSAFSMVSMDCLFNAVEKLYPQLFSPAMTATQVGNPYYFRYYSQTNSYIAISSADNHLYSFLSGGVLRDMGASSAWFTTSGCK